ncbi:MAG: hypothetical protein U0L09_02115, partial [Christensenellales bacterium]|nr:hypothetical protein [Christensenellales bacterium]
LHGADEARTEEILAGVKEAMEGLVGLHNVRDDMMFILKFLQEKGDVSTGVMDDERLVHIAGEILTAADQVMGDRIEELDAALAEISAIDEETVGWSVQLSGEMGKGLKMLDPEELAEVESHIRELANAVLQADQDARNEQIKHVWDDHIAKKLDQRNYDVLLGMEDEEILTLARNLLRVAYNWQNGLLDDALRDEQKALMQNEGDLSEEEVATLKDSVAKKIETMGVPEEHKERAVDNLFNDLIVVSRFSEEEKVLANRFLNCLYRKLEEKLLDAAQLVELENEMETLLYELAGDSEKYAVTPEDLAAVLENVDLEKVESLSDNAKFFLSIRFMEHFEVYSMLTEEYRAKLPEVDQALHDAIKGLEVKGQETTMEQLQVLEKVIYDVLSQMDIPVEVLVKEVAKTVSNCLFMSALTAEEQETIEAVLEAISQTLAEGNREEIRVLRNYYHQVQHHMEEEQVKPQLQNDQA